MLEALFAAALFVASSAIAAPPELEIERREELAIVQPGSLVTVDNSFGDVRARFGGYTGQVEVRAAIQQFVAEGPRLQLEVVEVKGGLRVAVGERPDGAGGLRTERQPGQKKRADLVLFVPRGVNLATTTREGQIEIRGLEGDVTARSASGAIHARAIRGDLDLASDQGSIVAVPQSLDRRAVQRFASVSGDITLHLDPRGHYTCRLSTRGRLSTDFSLTVEDDPADARRRRALAKVGKGTMTLAVTSRDGHVRLVRRPPAAEARVFAPEEPQ